MMRSTSRAVVLATAGLLALTACTPDLPELRVDPAPTTATPVLTVEQDQAVFDKIGALLTETATSLDPSTLETRLTGPALTLRGTELAVAAKTGDSSKIREMPSALKQQVLPTSATWPRITMGVTEVPQDMSTERLVVAEQAGPREPYKLWGWVRLFSGITLPLVAAPEIGSEAVAADDPSLVMTPADAIAHYADILLSGDGSAYAAEFGSDPLRTDRAANKANLEVHAATAEGALTLQYTPVDGDIRALRTADGGALVMGHIQSTGNITGKEGATIAPRDTQQPFLVDVAPSNSLSWGETILVGMYIPPAGSEGGPTVLGGEILTTSASIP